MMKVLIRAVALFLGCASISSATDLATITTLRAVHALSNADVTRGLPVAFEGTVTYFRGYEKTLFVQDGNAAIFVKATTDAKLVPGDRVLIRGTALSSFRPYVLSSDLTFLRHGTLPKPVPANFDQLIRAQRDCLLVKVRGKVRTADVILSSMTRSINLQLLVDHGTVDVSVDSAELGDLQDLLDGEIEVTGAESGQFDGKMHQTGVLIHGSSLADVKILNRASSDPWSLPATPMDEILAGYHGLRLSQRIRVHGTVTYFDPGVAMVLQDGDKSLWIKTRSIAPVRLGDIVDVTGFPDVRDGFLNLIASEIRKRGSHTPVAALPVQWRDLVSSKHVFDLVSIEGKVVTSIREASQDEYVLVSDGDKFSAIYRHPQTGVLPLLAMAQIPVGARVRVTGICVLDSSNPFNQDVPFNILVRSSSDISVVEQPSWLNIRNLILIVAGLLVLVAGVGAKSWALERKVRGQTRAMTVRVETEAALERRRSTILEDINESRPLAEIMEEIVELVSFKLEGVPCWCQIPGEAQLGDCPPDGHSLRVVRAEIPARSEPALGAIFVGLNPENPPVSGELEALSVGTRLATLAIETRKLYSEMRHRSEFDLLTEVHNRFSLDRYLDAKIEDARLENGVFGLIYVDLDRFKQVNDVYGHLVGDMYLREVALRLKRQLRSHDMLARLGGDEFAVLVQAIHSRAEVEEIALRLEHCFDEPFAMEGYVLHGSASIGIALYPEDGQTRDSLLSSSDAAMYVAKETKRTHVPILIEP